MKRFAMGLNAKCNGGERELASGETEQDRERVWEAEHMRKKEIASVQRSSSYLHKHKEEMQSNKKDKLCR